MKDGIYLYKRECVRRDDLNRKVKAFEEAIVEIYTEESDEITRFVMGDSRSRRRGILYPSSRN